eukprot:SAG11_NODE_883_length_6737_cov_10.576981_3_plen_158_part_00
MEAFLADAAKWTALGAAELGQLKSVAQSIRADGVFAADDASLGGWNQQLKLMAHSDITDTRWAAAYLFSATARAAHIGLVLAHADSWMQVLLPLLKTGECEYVRSMAAVASSDILQHARGESKLLKLDSNAVLAKLMPALVDLRAIYIFIPSQPHLF